MAFFDEEDGGLVAHLKSVSAITTHVGTGTSAKIWPWAAKQGEARPYVIYECGESEPIINLGGLTGLRPTPVHFYCWGTDYSEAKALAEAVNTALAAMRGTYSGTIVFRVQCSLADGGFEFRQNSNDAKDFWVRIVARIVHSE